MKVTVGKTNLSGWILKYLGHQITWFSGLPGKIGMRPEKIVDLMVGDMTA